MVCTRRLGWSLSPHRVPANQRRPDAGPSRRPPLTARRTARRTVLVFQLHGGGLAPAWPAEPCLICHRCGAGLAPARPAGLQFCRHCRPAIGPAGGCAECEGHGIGPGAPELGGSRSRILRLGRGPSKRRPIARGAVGAVGAVYCAAVCRQHRAAQQETKRQWCPKRVWRPRRRRQRRWEQQRRRRQQQRPQRQRSAVRAESVEEGVDEEGGA